MGIDKKLSVVSDIVFVNVGVNYVIVIVCFEIDSFNKWLGELRND